jgi:hypothetical protein
MHSTTVQSITNQKRTIGNRNIRPIIGNEQSTAVPVGTTAKKLIVDERMTATFVAFNPVTDRIGIDTRGGHDCQTNEKAMKKCG